jgi:hypothetical protein
MLSSWRGRRGYFVARLERVRFAIIRLGHFLQACPSIFTADAFRKRTAMLRAPAQLPRSYVVHPTQAAQFGCSFPLLLEIVSLCPHDTLRGLGGSIKNVSH